MSGSVGSKTVKIGGLCMTAGIETISFETCTADNLAQQWTLRNAKLTSKHVFDDDEFRSYNLQLSSRDVKMLVADPTLELYVPCTFTTDYGTELAKTVTGAGCRYKGSVGSLRMCVDGATKKENGECRKLSLKVDVNKFRQDSNNMNGLGKYVFNGMPVDYSLMSERVVYSLYQDADITSSRAVHAKIYVNGNFNGVYTMVENLDTGFMRRNFKNDDNEGRGGIYKDPWFNSISSVVDFFSSSVLLVFL